VDARDVFALMRTAGADRAARHAHRPGFALPGRGWVRRRVLALAQREMRAFRRHALGPGELEQTLQDVLGGSRLGAADTERAAPAADLDAEAALEQLQVLIERPAQIGEACVVLGLEVELAVRRGRRGRAALPRGIL
jgi:hypothetical protein